MSLVNHPLTTPKIKFFRDHGLNDKLYDSMIEDCRHINSITELSTRLIECLGGRVCLGFIQIICNDINTKNSSQIREVIKNYITSSYGTYSDSFLSIAEKNKWVKAAHLIQWDKKYLKAFNEGVAEKEKERIKIEKEVEEWNKNRGL